MRATSLSVVYRICLLSPTDLAATPRDGASSQRNELWLASCLLWLYHNGGRAWTGMAGISDDGHPWATKNRTDDMNRAWHGAARSAG